jgi:RNA polymerase sigma-70 factor (ECF subfamily)
VTLPNVLAAAPDDAREGDEARFAGLVARHGPAVARLCSYRERDDQARLDLRQDILIAIWEAMPRLVDVRSERAWVLRIAHNVAATHVERAARGKRAARIEHSEVQIPDPVSAEKRAEDRLRLEALFARLRTLDLLSQQLVLLHLEGLDGAEIAEATGITPTNVTTRLSRIRKWLASQEEAPKEPGT